MIITPAQRVAEALRAAAPAAGYDLQTRGGSRIRLAEEANTSPTTITRLLGGERLPEARTITLLARAVDADPIEFLIAAEILDPEDLSAEQAALRRRTPEQWVAQLGLQDPADRALLLAMAERLQRAQREREDTARTLAKDVHGRVDELVTQLAHDDAHHAGDIPEVLAGLHRLSEDLQEIAHPDEVQAG